MKLWSVLALNGRSLSSEEAEKTASSSHKQDFVLNSKIGLGSAMEKRDTYGLYKIWTRNHTVVTLKCEVNRRQQKHLFSDNHLHQSQKNDALLWLWLSKSTKN